MIENKLYMLLLGCKPDGRFTEQHDIFFGIAESLKALTIQITQFWPEANGKIHIDVWREVTCVDGLRIQILPRNAAIGPNEVDKKLFFLNLGGYKKDDFEEYHYKVLSVGKDKVEVIANAKKTAFFRHTGFEGAPSHIDDKYGIDVDDLYEIADLLPRATKETFRVAVTGLPAEPDPIHAGYLKLSNIPRSL